MDHDLSPRHPTVPSPQRGEGQGEGESVVQPRIPSFSRSPLRGGITRTEKGPGFRARGTSDSKHKLRKERSTTLETLMYELVTKFYIGIT